MKRSGSWMVLAAAVCWGTTGTVQALAPEGAQPIIIGTIRLVLGGIALVGYALLRGAFKGGVKWPIGTTFLAGLSMICYNLLFFSGVDRTGVAVGTIVGIGSAPILAGIVGYFLRGERPDRWWAMATGLAICGCVFLVAPGSRVYVDILGVLLAIGAGLSYAVFTVTSKGLIEHHPPEAVMAVIFGIGAILTFPLFLTTDLSWVAQPKGIAVAIHLGLVTVGLAYTLFGRGLQLVSVATAATLTLAEPLTAGILGVVVLGEQLTPATFLGMAFIFAGLALLTYGQRKSHRRLIIG
jgi:DME family drug/metabolite transporter